MKLPFLLALLAWPLLVPAQSYNIHGFTISGGGTSTNGAFTESGAIGLPDAGVMSGGGYTLIGGFWGVVAAVQTPGAPLLSVTRSNAVVIVAWPASAEGWRLQATTNLVTLGSVWTEIPPPYLANGTNLVISELSPKGNKFYRLHQP